ncbi:MAG: DoxX family protein [Flavobacteriaceae bacterium]|nr:DoxX family protein [Flavobacteriaceae bacterium]
MINSTAFTVPILILIYILITFLYSAIEKLLKWRESVGFYTNHFKYSFIKNFIPLLLIIVIILELISSVLCLTGIYHLIVFKEKIIGFNGLVLAAITLIGLMFGQRIAKDYSGAMQITVYFILTVFGAFLLQ